MSRKNRKKKVKAEAAETPQAESNEVKEDDIEPRDASSSEHEDVGLEAVETESGGELERLVAEAQEMRLLAQRKQAEFENFRRRVERERGDVVRDATASAVREILPVLDNLERAVDAAKATGTGGDEKLREGVEIICKQFRDTLVKQGVTEVEAAEAAFDPHVHEAVGRVETDDYPEGTVVEVHLKGYLIKDRLLRPAMVTVSSPTGGDDEKSSDEHESADEAVPQNGS